MRIIYTKIYFLKISQIFIGIGCIEMDFCHKIRKKLPIMSNNIQLKLIDYLELSNYTVFYLIKV